MKRTQRHRNLNEQQPNHYKWGLFYYNPADHRIIVPKSVAWMGWTVNFANPLSYVFIAGIMALAWWIIKLLGAV